jgi:hypothetical protein
MPRKKAVVEGYETNEQFVSRVMGDKQSDLTSIFVIEAIRRYAAQCAETDAAKLDTGPISGHAWKRTAIKLRVELTKHQEQ